MRKLMCIKRIACLIMAISLISVTGYTEPAQQVDTNVSTQLINAKSGILMEASTGEVLYEQNANERLRKDFA